MRNFLRATLLAGMLLAGGSVFGAQFSIGIRIGPPPRPRIFRVRPLSPGPEYMWIEGYWYPVGNHWKWHKGYWTRAPYPAARWIVPRYEGGQFFDGYWEGERGRIEHNHRWDRDRDRDYRERERDRDRDRH